jgi:hypothetical protein
MPRPLSASAPATVMPCPAAASAWPVLAASAGLQRDVVDDRLEPSPTAMLAVNASARVAGIAASRWSSAASRPPRAVSVSRSAMMLPRVSARTVWKVVSPCGSSLVRASTWCQ